jgi:purine-nucleoside phosphorylase
MVWWLKAELRGRSSPIALVLGSGLGGIAHGLEDPWIHTPEQIPGYPASTVVGHQGRLLLGRLEGRDIWVVQGRVHLYEGYSVEQVTRYVRLLSRLGVDTLILTNAAGSVVPEVGPGDLLLAVDGLNLFHRCLARPAPQTGVPFPVWRIRSPLSDPGLVRLAQEVALQEEIPLRLGVLAGSLGPSYETAAEVRVWRQFGGTVASMSTVPEAVVARELGLRCLLFSMVSNLATGLSTERLSHTEVVRTAADAGQRLERLLRALVRRI